MRLPWVVTLVCATSLIGCGPTSDAARPTDIEPDALYTFGDSRDDLETRFGPGRFYWILDEVPKDEFAAASIKANVAIRRPRPAAYEVFSRRRASTKEAYYRDYVFYNDRLLVLYTARRNPN